MFGWKRIAELEAQLAAQAELFDGMVKSHAKEIKRVSDLQEKCNGLADQTYALSLEIQALKEAQRQAGRKKVRRRDPQTGRFIWDYTEELSE